MNLYLISQNVNSDWDTFDSAVVAAKSARDAKETNPDGCGEPPSEWDDEYFFDWAVPEDVTVEYIGKASAKTKAGVICSSFNAG